MLVIETFESLQGEGPKTGTPSLFIRLCGCNMRCKFNCKNKEEEKEIEGNWKKISGEVKEGKIKALKHCPLFDKGCDSYPAIIPGIYSGLAKKYSEEDLLKLILSSKKVQDIVWTGGEPMMYLTSILRIYEMYKEDRMQLELFNQDFIEKDFWFETNGTIQSIPLALQKRMNIVCSPKFKYMDQKLREGFDKNVQFLIQNPYLDMYFKFVVEDVEDFNNLINQEKSWIDKLGRYRFYIMPQGAFGDEEFLERSTKIADRCVELGFNFSLRIQNILYNNNWGK